MLKQTEFLDEEMEGTDAKGKRGMLEIPFAQVDQIVSGDLEPLRKISDRRSRVFFLDGTLHGEQRSLILQHDKIDLPFVGVPEVAKFHGIPFGLFDEIAIFQQMGGDQIFKPGAGVGDDGPIPEIRLLLLFDGADLRGAVGWKLNGCRR